MIRHYDMTTGEEVVEETQGEREEFLSFAGIAVSPRLMTVQEATALQAREPGLPVDIAILPVESILAKWS